MNEIAFPGIIHVCAAHPSQRAVHSRGLALLKACDMRSLAQSFTRIMQAI